VATDAGEVPFLVRNGENGFVVNSDGGDVPGRMAERIRACLETRWNRESIAAAMRAFTWERAAGEILVAVAAKDQAERGRDG
jgi:glycosyltransferase involved in cell wall biosynthesis